MSKAEREATGLDKLGPQSLVSPSSPQVPLSPNLVLFSLYPGLVKSPSVESIWQGQEISATGTSPRLVGSPGGRTDACAGREKQGPGWVQVHLTPRWARRSSTLCLLIPGPAFSHMFYHLAIQGRYELLSMIFQVEKGQVPQLLKLPDYYRTAVLNFFFFLPQEHFTFLKIISLSIIPSR